MTRSNPRLLLITLVVAGFVSACSTPTWTSPPGPERFQIGYRDGCDAGYAVAGSPFYDRIEHAEPGDQDSHYAHGWKIGFSDCKRSYDRIQATVHSFFGV